MGSRLNETFTQNKLRNRRSKLWTESPSDVFKSSSGDQTSKPQNVSRFVNFKFFPLCPIFSISLPAYDVPPLPGREQQSLYILYLPAKMSSHRVFNWENWLISCWQGRTKTMVWRCLLKLMTNNWKLARVFLSCWLVYPAIQYTF